MIFMKIGTKQIKTISIEILETMVGACLMAMATSLFLLPNQLSSGGFAGIATIFYYFLKIPMGATILAFNIPLFLFSAYKLGKMFLVKSMIGTVTFSIFIEIFENIPPLTQDRFLACIYGGIIIGLGTAIILKANSSTGGSDLVSMLVKEYRPEIRMSNVIIIIDTVIVGLNVLFFKEIEVGLYSALAIYLMGKMIDIIFEGIYFTKLVIIISDRSQEIAEKIGERVRRGTTGLYGKGMYTNENKVVLMCAASRGDVAKVRNTAKSIDPKSFIIIANAREVVGLGFKK